MCPIYLLPPPSLPPFLPPSSSQDPLEPNKSPRGSCWIVLKWRWVDSLNQHGACWYLLAVCLRQRCRVVYTWRLTWAVSVGTLIVLSHSMPDRFIGCQNNPLELQFVFLLVFFRQIFFRGRHKSLNCSIISGKLAVSSSRWRHATRQKFQRLVAINSPDIIDWISPPDPPAI